MGISESKQELGQIVVIYGYKSMEMSWKDFDNRTVYRTSGLIVEHNDKIFVLTTRTKLISCKTIVMYHSYFSGTEPVMRQELSIVFQSIKHNIIILASASIVPEELTTKENRVLDLALSEIIHGEYDPQLRCPTNKINNNQSIVPTKRSQYFMSIMDININDNVIKYTTKIIKIKYVDSKTYDQSYLSEKYMFVFRRSKRKILFNEENNNLVGVCGAVIFDIKHRPLGIVSMTNDNKIFVIPIKQIKKIFNEFYNFRLEPKLYYDHLILPFICNAIKGKIVIVSNCEANTTNGKFIFMKNDVITHICDNPIKFIDGKYVVLDKDYQQYLSINSYLEMTLSANCPIKINLRRNKKNISSSTPSFSLNVYPIKNEFGIPYTGQPNYDPKEMIPYIIIKDLVVVELTH